MSSVVLVVACMVVPAILVFLSLHSTLLQRVGLVLLSFGAGMAVAAFSASVPVLQYADGVAARTNLTEIAIALAMPLLLFTLDLRAARHAAVESVRAVVIAALCVVAVAVLLVPVFAGQLPDIAEIAGLAVGAYTGGGANMAAVKVGVGADVDLFVLMTTYDILVSAMFLLVLLAVIRWWSASRSGAGAHSSLSHSAVDATPVADEGPQAMAALVSRANAREGALALVVAVAVVMVALGMTQLVATMFATAASGTLSMIMITSLGLVCASLKSVQRLQASFQLGMYLVLVFCFTLGTLTDFSELRALNMPLLGYLLGLVTGAVLLHALLCRWMGVRTELIFLSAAAAILSVPFVPLIVAALRQPRLLVPGFAMAILGYALGNYLGIGTTLLLRFWQPS